MPLSKAAEKRIRSLFQKKQRDLQKKFLVEGEKMILELLEHNSLEPSALWLTDSFIEKNSKYLNRVKWERISEQALKKVSAHKSPQGGVAVVKKPLQVPLNKDKSLVLYLDGLQDPGNLGTLIRLADWFGLEQILCSPDTVDHLNPKVVRASMGAVLRVAVLQADLAQAKTALATHQCLGATMTGKSMYKFDESQKRLLVIGNEGNGITEKNRDQIDEFIAIPKFGKSSTESLNAGVAGGILISHLIDTHNM